MGTGPSLPVPRPLLSAPLEPQRRDQDGKEEQDPALPVPPDSPLGIRERFLLRNRIRGQLGLARSKRSGILGKSIPKLGKHLRDVIRKVFVLGKDSRPRMSLPEYLGVAQALLLGLVGLQALFLKSGENWEWLGWEWAAFGVPNFPAGIRARSR